MYEPVNVLRKGYYSLYKFLSPNRNLVLKQEIRYRH